MRILFTNNTLDTPAGTELSVFDFARTLKARGHDAVAFSSQHGEVARRLQSADLRIIDRFETLPKDWRPDVIHGHHEWETSLAALHFPGTPVISFCRGITPWQEVPCRAPNVVRYVAVDRDCRSRLVDDEGISEDEVTVVLNGVDLERFPARPPLPEKPGRVLVFSNYAREDNYFSVIRNVCERSGIVCEAIGSGMNRTVPDPETILATSDLVFAKGKAALEALVSGCGVIVCDEPGIGALVTPENLEPLREQSFGYPCMTESVTEEAILSRLSAWDRKTVEAAGQLARETCSLDATVDQLEIIYSEAVEKWSRQEKPAERAMIEWAADFFESVTVPYKLGREMAEIWRRQRSLAEPDSLASRYVEQHRIMHAFRRAEEKIAEYESRLRDRDEKIEGLKAKLGETNGTERRRLKFWRR